MSKMYSPGQTPHDPTKCRWQMIGKSETGVRLYRCEHGWTSEGHPRGWCDQGCCR